MPFTDEDWLPSPKEIDPTDGKLDLNLTSAPLMAGAAHFGRYCEPQCLDYMLCKRELHDPRRCLPYGQKVSECAQEFYGQVKKNCAVEFSKYTKCIDHGSRYFGNYPCRKEQASFNNCMSEKLGLDRPPVCFYFHFYCCQFDNNLSLFRLVIICKSVWSIQRGQNRLTLMFHHPRQK